MRRRFAEAGRKNRPVPPPSPAPRLAARKPEKSFMPRTRPVLRHLSPDVRAAVAAASDFITDREAVETNLLHVPRELHAPAVRAWARMLRAAGNRAANLEMLALGQAFSVGGLDFTADDDEIIALAKVRARDVRGHVMDLAQTSDVALRDRLERYARNHGVPAPKVKSLRGLTVRMCCDKWWRRALRRSIVRELERHARALGFVHRRAGLYASDEAVERRRKQRARNARILSCLEAENDDGEAFTLAELSSRNVSNPAVRRAELMTRIAGFEAFAQARGDAAVFYTLTCPSRMHARHYQSGEPVENYDGSTPRDAQSHLCRTWARIRAMFKRRRLYPYGFRIAEPHHDGTPHWHLLLFMRADAVPAVTKIFERYAYEADAEELSTERAREARFKAVAISWDRGSAAGYVAKYVAKNIDGFEVGADLEATGENADSTCRRVDAWAATWGIRQFQQVGGPGVTIWRELRRLPGPQQLPLFDPLREHADAGAWADYVRAMNGIEVFKRDRTLQLWRVDYERENRYGEQAPAAVEGVEHIALEQCRTRLREWRIGRVYGVAAPRGSNRRFGEGASALDRGAEGDAGQGQFGGGALRERGNYGSGNGAAVGENHGRLTDLRQRASAAAEEQGIGVQLTPLSGSLSAPACDGAATGAGGRAPRGENAGRQSVPAGAVAFGVPWTGVNNCTRVCASKTCDDFSEWLSEYERASEKGERWRT